MRILRIGRFRFLKRLRISFSLIKTSLKLIFFEHYKYLIFCVLLSATQFLAFMATGFIHSRLKISLLISESLAGLNFFEILFDSVPSITSGKLMSMAFILWAELFIVYALCSAISYYTMYHEVRVFESFKIIRFKWKQLLFFALFETVMLFFCALLGFIGDIIYFLWQWITIFTIQLITFEPISVIGSIKKSLSYFKKNLVYIVGIDSVFELGLIALAGVLYYAPGKALSEPVALALQNYGAALVLLYVISIVYVIETITFTLFYKVLRSDGAMS